MKKPWNRKPPIRITLAMYRLMRSTPRAAKAVVEPRKPGTVYRLPNAGVLLSRDRGDA